MATNPDPVDAWLTLADQRLMAAKVLMAQHLFDDAISRAYYSMFSAASAALASINVTSRSHTGLRSQLGLHFVQTGLLDPRYAKMLARAFEARQGSDYEIFNHATHLEAEAVIANAEEFVKIIKNLLSEIE